MNDFAPSTGINDITSNIDNGEESQSKHEENIPSHSSSTAQPSSIFTPIKNCPACLNSAPTGGHKCVTCSEAIHNLDGCSFALDSEDEGYNQKRICFSCFVKQNNAQRNPEHVNTDESIADRGNVPEFVLRDSTKPNIGNKYGKNNQCVACGRNEEPTGHYKCSSCDTAIHILDGCSFPVDHSDDEYNQKRICYQCYKLGGANIIIASREKENWRGLNQSPPKKRARKVAKYHGANAKLISEQIKCTGDKKK